MVVGGASVVVVVIVEGGRNSGGTDSRARCKLSATSNKDLAKLLMANCRACSTSRFAMVRVFSCSAKLRNKASLSSRNCCDCFLVAATFASSSTGSAVSWFAS